jgi:sulfopyruvate decarboxylase subunit alpha
MASARLIIEQLSASGITHVVALPDNTSKALLEGLSAEQGIRVVSVTREGECWAVAAGLWMGGGSPAVLMQNTGFLESGDALRGTVMRMRIPLLCLLTYRGYATLARTTMRAGIPTDGSALSRPDVDSCAIVFEPTLQAWGVPYDFLHEDTDVGKIRSTLEEARRREHPAALLITRDTTR